jgi:hypothetical protein
MNAYAFSNPFIHLDSLSLVKTKLMIHDGTATKQTIAAYQKLLRDTDKLLKISNPTVVDKTILAPTKNKHDYLSISRYWWPNPETENGLPWVRQDGKTNPDTQTDAVDRPRLSLMAKSVWNLSLAYYFTNNEKYAQKAISMIETWFLNEDTLMNPHLEYAQSVPGNSTKRPSGILDGRVLVMYIPDAINLLSNSKYWNQNYKTKTKKWFSDYLNWLTTSDLGIKGSQQENNHGSWYKFQVAGLALYVGDTTLVKNTVKLAEKSLDNMLNNEGGQIHELARTRSFFYSCFNLQALSNIAVLADRLGMDMWQYETENKRSLFLALNYLTPVVNGEKWKHDTLKSIDTTGLIPIILLIPKEYRTLEYKNVLTKILNNTKENNSFQEFWLLNINQL